MVSRKTHLQELLEKYFDHTSMSFFGQFNQDSTQSSDPDDNTNFPLDIEQSLRPIKEYLGFISPNPEEVARYLRQNNGLYDAVLYACMLTEEEFANTAQITLELYSDPEIDDEYLILCIRQSHYDEDIMDKIDRICSQCEPDLDSCKGWFVVTTDFRTPTA